RPGRRRQRRHHGREPGRRGRGRRRHARRARFRHLHAGGRRALLRSAADARGARQPAGRDGVSRDHDRRAGADRRRGRDRPGLRVGRGGAPARPVRGGRRPRLDRLDGERERAAADRDAAGVAGRADRQPRPARRAPRARRSARADDPRRRRGAAAEVRDAERAGSRPPPDPRAAAGHGRAVRAAPGRGGPDRRARGRRHGRDLGSAAAAEGGRRHVDPRRPGGAAGAVRGDARKERDAAGATVADVVADVRERGDAAVREWAERFGDGPPRRVEPRGALDERSRRAVRALAAAVEAVHAAQRPVDATVSPLPGIEVERRWLPVDSVGIYVPAGLVSSLVMTAVPARIAGVPRIAVVSPRPSDALFAVAAELGLTEVYAVGGAQAIAALAYGTQTSGPVAKIVGPGNRYVTEAKLLVSDRVGIDLPAGPSEVLVIADDTADPASF